MEKECRFFVIFTLHFASAITCSRCCRRASLIKLVARVSAVIDGSLDTESFAKFNKDNASQHDGRIDNSHRDKDI